MKTYTLYQKSHEDKRQELELLYLFESNSQMRFFLLEYKIVVKKLLLFTQTHWCTARTPIT